MTASRERYDPVLDDTFNPGGAFWCTEHPTPGKPGQMGRLECTKTAKARDGGRCHKPAIRGRNACQLHGGMSVQKAKDLGEITISAWSALGRPKDGKQIDPGAAVLAMLQMSWLRAAYYGTLLRQQAEKNDGFNPDDPLSTFQGDRERAERQGQELEAQDEARTEGLIGYRWAAAGQDGVLYKQSEEVRALVGLEAAERDRVVKYAKIAHDMGISDRLTSMAERWGDAVATRITMMLDGLDLTPEQQLRVPMLVESHLGSIDLTEIGG